MIRAPHATHRLAHLRAARPEDAAEELRAVLTEAQGDVAGAARALGVTRVTVHRWVTAWGLRGWLEATWPRGERARRGLLLRKDRAMISAKEAKKAFTAADEAAVVQAERVVDEAIRQSDGSKVVVDFSAHAASVNRRVKARLDEMYRAGGWLTTWRNGDQRDPGPFLEIEVASEPRSGPGR